MLNKAEANVFGISRDHSLTTICWISDGSPQAHDKASKTGAFESDAW